MTFDPGYSTNIRILPIGGSRNYNYYANNDILQKISSKSPIPCLFVIDKDEKSTETITKIVSQTNKVHIFEQREIENYLLNPSCILEALLEKAKFDNSLSDSLNNVTVKNVEELMLSEIDKLEKTVILKHIKEEIGGSNFISDDIVQKLVDEETGINLEEISKEIYAAVKNLFNDRCNEQKIKELIKQQISMVKGFWEKGYQVKKKIIPGKTLLNVIYSKYGMKYKKNKDGERIAKKYTEDDIPGEIKTIIEKIQV